ncbi:single-stranded DNA-binding protein [Sediminicola luteus]|uniref:Single-stranded DNA-binding protein n=1 Tax=Sediminicola luteus TaxID=319238 RepID=A0A2A4G3Z2_9FLAO|nr:single-stranded DNA-binding protein [Sediminicola luteus]PCE63143.1 single-stranded DNA-binding protein [Sediminicola luteus]
MGTLRNQVRLIGNVGQDPKVTDLESGKKVARLRLATNEFYKDAQGNTQKTTDWHMVIAWGKTAHIIQRFVTKGMEMSLEGKLRTRSFPGPDGNQRYVTEIVAENIHLPKKQ